MKDPELKIRDLLLMDWSEEEWKKLRDWLKQKAKKLNEDDATTSTQSSDQAENQTRSEPDETSPASEGSQGKKGIAVPPGYTLEEWNHVLDLL